MQVKDIGEFELIRRLTKGLVLPAGVIVGPGDDTAVVELAQDKYLLLTCDCMVEGVHFLADGEPYNVGYKLLASNISDIAAMGGVPKPALVTLVLPPDTSAGWVESMYQGLIECGADYDVAIVGGDVSQGKLMVFNLCLTGEVESGRQMLRSSALPGDLVVVTGALGASLAGLEILTGQASLKSPWREEALSRHLRPQPKVVLGQLLSEIACRCANDISDGLARECWEVAEASGVAIQLDASLIPVATGAMVLCSQKGEDPVLYALRSGEEYELLFCLSPELWEQNKEALQGCCVIGEVVDGQGVFLRSATDMIEVDRLGWTHF